MSRRFGYRLPLCRRGAAAIILGIGIAGWPPAACGDATPSCPRCNVVLVTFDALRADRLGTYGYTRPTSPAIDAFARRSTVFEDCLSQSATTVTAVPAILTGRFPATDRLLDRLVLRASEETLATVLRRAGYRTLAVISHTFAGCQYSGCAGFDVVADAPPVFESTAVTIDRTLRLLDADAREPFFLWVHVRVPHAPYDATADEFARMYDGPDPTWFSPGVHTVRFFETLARLVAHYRHLGEPVQTMEMVDGRRRDTTPTTVRQFRALYDANVRLGDGAFRQILRYLKRRQMMRRSVVVLGADHGEGLGEHGVIGHNRLLHAMLHTPLVVYVPGERGRRLDAPVMNVDILPTVTRIVGVPLPQAVRGRDAFAPPGPDAVQYAEHRATYVVVRRGQKVDVSTLPAPVLKPATAGGPKGGAAPPTVVTESEVRVTALFDLSQDPEEMRNLAAERPALADELLRLGEALRGRQIVTEPRPPAEEVFDRLKALGYLAPDATTER